MYFFSFLKQKWSDLAEKKLKNSVPEVPKSIIIIQKRSESVSGAAQMEKYTMKRTESGPGASRERFLMIWGAK